ncbi:hypothetical protein PCASD_12702 [Puccinia coronata f. sp. avenae]|uniref:Uncharacterized protein n=1 Tax=Puccinia coronata f. sp. avenae TaxID=200324 RepID=A0A2N5UCM5_9BASI|nr:hypothetical protein PCASD_12702 [Puccinia coronata f. sp. avenae]
MPSHLRNGKDLSFEQQEAAKRESKKAAERAQQRLQRATEQQQPEGAKLASNLDYSSRVDFGRLAEIVSSSYLGTTELHDPASHRSAAGGYPPVGYTFSPAALELLSRAQEQRLDADGSQGYGSALAGASLPPRPQDRPSGPALARDVSGVGAQQTHAGPLPRGETSFCRHEKRLPSPLDGWVYDADTKSHLSPKVPTHQRDVYRSFSLQSTDDQGSRNVPGHRLASSRQDCLYLEHLPGTMALLASAKGAKNMFPMRIALNLAISMLENIKGLLGTQSMSEVSNHWLARDKLARLDLAFQQTISPPTEPSIARTLLRLAIAST